VCEVVTELRDLIGAHANGANGSRETADAR
jgi:hypothetical protein